VLVFEYVSIRKTRAEFVQVPVAEYEVDLKEGSVRESVVSEVVNVRSAHRFSPVREGTRPGSYVPLGS